MQVNDDRVIEFTEDKPVKLRFSEKQQLERKAYLEASIAKFQAELESCITILNSIHEAEK